jgi:hypothetical protein
MTMHNGRMLLFLTPSVVIASSAKAARVVGRLFCFDFFTSGNFTPYAAAPCPHQARRPATARGF